jgi:hypothetical protein
MISTAADIDVGIANLEAKKKEKLAEKNALLKEIAKAEKRIQRIEELKRIQQGGEANPTSKKFLEVAKSAAVQ